MIKCDSESDIDDKGKKKQDKIFTIKITYRDKVRSAAPRRQLWCFQGSVKLRTGKSRSSEQLPLPAQGEGDMRHGEWLWSLYLAGAYGLDDVQLVADPTSSGTTRLGKLLARTESSSDTCGQPERFAEASDTCIRRVAKPVVGMNDMRGLYQNSP
ncbi:hypothetical protein llap_7031 [Limosa lapponica baueri]|uniref:Uncharacterized protein n=1 Tax=Limosa lapponica baueri TaxID=1758121 RepID=A0A2I0U9C5_LIMLA|nr:hypothetical protein llap_7031 [Limosa lapponica baueri]